MNSFYPSEYGFLFEEEKCFLKQSHPQVSYLPIHNHTCLLYRHQQNITIGNTNQCLEL